MCTSFSANSTSLMQLSERFQFAESSSAAKSGWEKSSLSNLASSSMSFGPSGNAPDDAIDDNLGDEKPEVVFLRLIKSGLLLD